MILPPSLSLDAFGIYKYCYRINNAGSGLPQIIDHDAMQRANWLSLGGTRHAYAVNAGLCRDTIPCVVDAYYPGVPEGVITADRYAIMGFNESTELYLRPDHYQLRASESEGRTLSQGDIHVP